MCGNCTAAPIICRVPAFGWASKAGVGASLSRGGEFSDPCRNRAAFARDLLEPRDGARAAGRQRTRRLSAAMAGAWVTAHAPCCIRRAVVRSRAHRGRCLCGDQSAARDGQAKCRRERDLKAVIRDRRQRRYLVALALLFLAPRWALRSTCTMDQWAWRPAGRVNHGELIDPPRPLPALALPLVAADPVTAGSVAISQSTDPDFLKHKWTLLYWGPGTCSQRCRTTLYNTRQVRTALNRDQGRVQRVYIAGGERAAMHSFYARTAPGSDHASRASPGCRALARSLASSPAARTRSQARMCISLIPWVISCCRMRRRRTPEACSKIWSGCSACLTSANRCAPNSVCSGLGASHASGRCWRRPWSSSGAWVRLTDAGLGCPDWPGCYGRIYPESTTHQFAKALHEMVHRYFASTLGVIITSLFVWALLNRKDRGQPLLPVAVLFVVVCVQGALGARTVTLLLQPLIVTAHLLGGLSTLGLLWWLSLEPTTRQLTEQETTLRKYACGRPHLDDPADRARRLDQQQLRRGGLPGFTHLPALLVAADGLSGRLRAVART